MASEPTIEWTKLLGMSESEYAHALIAGADGAIYVAGYTTGNLDGQDNQGSYDAFVAKYNPDGTKAWTKLLGTTDHDIANALTAGADGAIYVAGYTTGNLDGQSKQGSYDAFVAKYTPDGTKAWTKLLGTLDHDIANALTAGADGAIYVAGYTMGDLDGQTNNGNYDAFVAKYNPDGTKAWTKLLGTLDHDIAWALTAGADGAIYVAGYTMGDLDGQTNNGNFDAFVAKYNPDGTKAWTKLLGTSGFDYARALTTGADGAVYVAGSTEGNLDGQSKQGSVDAFVAKYNPDGTKVWTKLLGTSVYDYADALTAGVDGAVYVAGNTGGNLDGQTSNGSVDAFIIKLTDTSSLSFSGNTFSLAENSIVGKSVGTLSATSLTGKTITYSITAGNTDVDKDSKSAFAINSSTGAITVNDAGDLNYEARKTFSLTVQASDGSLSSTATATINLTNVDEDPTGSVTINGTAIQGNKLTAVSTVKDPDGDGTAKYQWLRNDVAISGANASVYTLTTSDVGKSIKVKLSYTDGGGTADSVTSSGVTPSPLTGLEFARGGQYLTGVDEDLPTGNVSRRIDAWIKVEQESGLGSVIEWGSQVPKGGRFGMLVNEKGQIYFVGENHDLLGSANLKDGEFHKVSIVFDGSKIGIYVDGKLDIQSATSNLWPTTAKFSALNTVDNDKVFIGRSPGNGEQFLGEIARIAVYENASAPDSTLDFTLDSAKDRGLVSLYDFTDQVKKLFDQNAEDGSLTAFGSFNGEIVYRKENPIIDGKTFSVAENSSVNTSVGTLSATSPTGKAITYSITAGNTDVDKDGKTAFKINASTGAITVNDAGDLNYEGNPTFNLTVQASDGALSSTATATINITNVDEDPTGTVAITGTAVQGNKLSAVSTVKDPDGNGTAKYQWLRNEVAISGANTSTYTLNSSDVGKSIKVRLSYTDGDGFAESVTSAGVTAAGLGPGVSISGSDKTTGEDGNTAVFAVSLNAAPTGNVTLNFAVSDTTEGKLNTSSLTFTKDNWSTPQTLTVTGVDDYANDGDVSYTLMTTVNSSDTAYQALKVTALTLVNKDDKADKPITDYIGTAGKDTYRGSNGNDVLYSGYGNDVLYGGRGHDRLYGEQNSDELFGEDGNDDLYGGYDDDMLYGGSGDDELYGEAGVDRLEGGTGNDYLDGGTGADRMIGGSGNDTYFVDNAKDVIDDQGAATDKDTVIVMATISYKLAANVENAELKDASGAASLTGNTLNNDLTGNGSKNTLDGGGGNDVLDAGAGNDTLVGGEGADILIGGLGTDSLSGGAGDDTADYSEASSAVNINLLTGKATGDGDDTLVSIEDVIGSEGRDIITGNTAGNELIGGLGADRMSLGQDTAVDLLIYRAVTESIATERDRISQFVSQQDRISLSGIDANSKVAGDQAFAFNGTTAKANALWYRQADVDGDKKTNDLIVYADVNGDSRADFEVGLVGVVRLVQADFVL
jgi:uncharacterized delta-60 repeat protein